MNRARVSRTKASLVAVAVLSLALAACGDDDDGAAGQATTANAGASAASGEPIRVGFTSLEGGTISLPQYRYGMDAATEYVNTELGGVKGRPIELVTCEVDGSPERSIDGANQFVEQKVVLVDPGRDFGADAILPVLETAGIPIVGAWPAGQRLVTSPNAYFLAISNEVSAFSIFSFLAEEREGSLVFIGADIAPIHSLSDSLFEPAAKAAGIGYRTVYYSGQPDFNVLAPTAMTDRPDVIGLLGAAEACTPFVTALKAAGFEGRIWAPCTAAVPELGEKAEGIVFSSAMWLPDAPEAAPADKQDEIEAYEEAMETAGHGDDVARFEAYTAFAQLVNLSRILEAMDGPINSAGVLDAVRATSDFDSFMGPRITCDGTAFAGRNVCSNSVLFWEVQADGSLTGLTKDFVKVSAPGAR